MRRLRPYTIGWLALAFFVLAGSAAAQRSAGYVVDQTGVLGDTDRQEISARLEALDDSASVQIVVVATRLEGISAADLALQMSRSMGLGRAGLNNGVLVLLAPADRAVRVSVGTGLEWQIPDSTAEAAVAQMLPFFREGEYAAGLNVGIDALAGRAASVPWAVRFESASEAAAAGAAAVGQVAKVRGTYTAGVLQTEAGPVALAFPVYWNQAQSAPQPGDALNLLARVVGATPLSVQVLGHAPAP